MTLYSDIENNIDKLNHKQQQTLLNYIAKINQKCIKQGSDGSRINLNKLDTSLLKKIYLFICNQIEYNAFFKDTYID